MAVSGIEVALGEHAISHDDRVIFGFDVVVVVGCDGFIEKDRSAVHKHTGRNKLSIEEQGVLRRNQHVLERNTV